jgi:hypothetical protein
MVAAIAATPRIVPILIPALATAESGGPGPPEAVPLTVTFEKIVLVTVVVVWALRNEVLVVKLVVADVT